MTLRLNIRTVAGLMLAVCLAVVDSLPAEAQFYGYGGYGRGGVSIRSPFFRMDINPYAGGRGFAPFPPPPLPFPLTPPFPTLFGSPFDGPAIDLTPRGWRPPIVGVPREQALLSPLEIPYIPPPRFEIPSYADIFPESSGLSNSPGDMQAQPQFQPQPQYQGSAPAVRLGGAVKLLTESLIVREDGEAWISYLKLNEVDLLVTDLSNLGTTSEFPVDRIRVLLINFDAVTESQEFTWLQALRGFAGTRGALTELIEPAFSGEPTTTEPLTDSINESDSDLGVEELPAPLPQSIQTIRTLKPYRGEA